MTIDSPLHWPLVVRARHVVRRLGAAVCALLLASAAAATEGPSLGHAPAWKGRLLEGLARIDAQGGARIGVYVRDLDTGTTASFHGDESWYLASTVKLPVAIAVLRGIERGQYGLDTRLTLRASDYVDGAGLTNSHAIGAPLTLRFLLEQMIIHSDNTASDMLIGLVGIGEVNAVVESLVPQGFGRITTLAEVRRRAYGYLVPAADQLSGHDLLQLKRQRSDAERLLLLGRIADTPVASFRMASLDDAYKAYYATGLNSARLDAYGELIAQLVHGHALSPTSTAYLLALMDRVVTGPQRIKAGLPPDARFAHKTGTQRGRFCDAGLVTVPRPDRLQRVVVVACTRGELSLVRSERALRQVGTALCRSGLLNGGIPDAPVCDAVALSERLPVAAER